MNKRSCIAATLGAVPIACGILGVAVSQNEAMAGSVSFYAGVDAGFVSAQHKVRKTLRVDTEDKKQALILLDKAKWLSLDLLERAFQSDGVRVAGPGEFDLDDLYSNEMFNDCRDKLNEQQNYNRRVLPSLPDEAEALSNEEARALIDSLKKDILEDHEDEVINNKAQYTLGFFLNHKIGGVKQIEELVQNDRRGGGNLAVSRDHLGCAKELLKDLKGILDRLEQKYLGELKSDPKVVKRNSGIAELNVGATYTKGKGLLGVEFLVGKNLKNKPKGAVERGGGVYYAGLARAGVLIRDKVELYVLGGMRINNSSPIVGAGMRVRLNNKLFMKLEYNDHCGKKKYPKYHLLKVGFGCRL